MGKVICSNAERCHHDTCPHKEIHEETNSCKMCLCTFSHIECNCIPVKPLKEKEKTMKLTIIYKFQEEFFVAGTFSCPVKEKDDTISLQIKKALYDDKIFIKNHKSATQLAENFRLKEFFPIKTYFEYEGYEIDDESINQIKKVLGGAETIWVNFQESEI